MFRNSAVGLLASTIILSATAAEIRLRSSIACPAPIVRLADVAEIRDDDPALAEALGQIALCPAPPSGIERALTLHEVRQILTLSGIEPGKVAVTGSEQIVLQAGDVPSAVPRVRPATATIRQALYSVESQPDRLGLGSRPAIPASTQAATVPEMKPERLVERGAGVVVHSRRPGVRITASGKALQPGANGELIGVEVGDSKQRVLARVIGPQTVEVASSANVATSNASSAAPSSSPTPSASP